MNSDNFARRIEQLKTQIADAPTTTQSAAIGIAGLFGLAHSIAAELPAIIFMLEAEHNSTSVTRDDLDEILNQLHQILDALKPAIKELNEYKQQLYRN